MRLLRWLTLGSSPRVRGKLFPAKVGMNRCGLIPACAGKTANRVVAGPVREAHPRVCGENRGNVFVKLFEVGSSPRVRGKLIAGMDIRSKLRLIPACAGKTNEPRPATDTFAAHPRVCGENFWTDLASDGSHGSSPRVRGKQYTGDSVEKPGRLIPACAGKTLNDLEF